MNASFKPIRLLLKVLSPVVVTAFSPSLDGVLFEALRQRMPDKSDDTIIEKLKTILEFNEEFGVFHASAMRFGITAKNGLTTFEYRRGDYLHEGKRSSTMFLPNGKGRYKDIVVTGGPTKKRMTIRPAYCAPYAVFDALGCPKAILDLLTHAFVGLGYDAQNAGMGAFDVENIEVISLDDDVSLIEDGRAKRLLPHGAASGLMAKSPLMPPYYSDVKHVCSAPDRITVINIEKL